MAKYTRSQRIQMSGFERVRAEQLNWLMYITKGHDANVAHALRTNNFCLFSEDVKALQRIHHNNEKNIALIEGIIHKRKKGA